MQISLKEKKKGDEMQHSVKNELFNSKLAVGLCDIEESSIQKEGTQWNIQASS